MEEDKEELTMIGVEILASTQVAIESTCNWQLGIFVLIGTIITGGVLAFFLAEKDNKLGTTICGSVFGALLGFFFFALTLIATEKPLAHETQYKVTIDDSVTMTEFYEHYEVIDQEGKIFTVREKSNNE